MSDHPHTENLLRRWLNGQITHREEQQLEQAARKDPFLAEALEGYRDRSDSDHQVAVQQLRRRIRQRSGRFVWRQALQLAAALALLLSASWMIWQFTRPGGQTPAISMNEDAAPATAETPAPEPALQQETATARTTPRKSSPAFAPTEEPLKTETLAQTAQPIPAAKPEEIAAASQPKVAETSSSLPAAPAPAAPLYSGTVTNETGRPLPNIAVLSDDDQFITRTDENGRFVTVQPPSGRILRFSPDGNNFQRIAPASENINRYVLPPQAGQVPDAARSLAPQKTVRSAPALQAAPQPAGGFSALQQHIRQNMRYPALALQYRIEGNVVLSFSISPNGLPGDFEILESPGYGLDLEAVRLLQTGPSWSGGIPGQRYVHTIEFKLP